MEPSNFKPSSFTPANNDLHIEDLQQTREGYVGIVRSESGEEFNVTIEIDPNKMAHFTQDKVVELIRRMGVGLLSSLAETDSTFVTSDRESYVIHEQKKMSIDALKRSDDINLQNLGYQINKVQNTVFDFFRRLSGIPYPSYPTPQHLPTYEKPYKSPVAESSKLTFESSSKPLSRPVPKQEPEPVSDQATDSPSRQDLDSSIAFIKASRAPQRKEQLETKTKAERNVKEKTSKPIPEPITSAKKDTDQIKDIPAKPAVAQMQSPSSLIPDTEPQAKNISEPKGDKIVSKIVREEPIQPAEKTSSKPIEKEVISPADNESLLSQKPQENTYSSIPPDSLPPSPPTKLPPVNEEEPVSNVSTSSLKLSPESAETLDQPKEDVEHISDKLEKEKEKIPAPPESVAKKKYVPASSPQTTSRSHANLVAGHRIPSAATPAGEPKIRKVTVVLTNPSDLSEKNESVSAAPTIPKEESSEDSNVKQRQDKLPIVKSPPLSPPPPLESVSETPTVPAEESLETSSNVNLTQDKLPIVKSPPLSPPPPLESVSETPTVPAEESLETSSNVNLTQDKPPIVESPSLSLPPSLESVSEAPTVPAEESLETSSNVNLTQDKPPIVEGPPLSLPPPLENEVIEKEAKIENEAKIEEEAKLKTAKDDSLAASFPPLEQAPDDSTLALSGKGPPPPPPPPTEDFYKNRRQAQNLKGNSPPPPPITAPPAIPASSKEEDTSTTPPPLKANLEKEKENPPESPTTEEKSTTEAERPRPPNLQEHLQAIQKGVTLRQTGGPEPRKLSEVEAILHERKANLTGGQKLGSDDEIDPEQAAKERQEARSKEIEKIHKERIASDEAQKKVIEEQKQMQATPEVDISDALLKKVKEMKPPKSQENIPKQNVDEDAWGDQE